MTLDNVRGVVGDGGDGVIVFIKDLILGGGVVLVIDDGRVGKFWGGEDKVVELLAV